MNRSNPFAMRIGLALIATAVNLSHVSAQNSMLRVTADTTVELVIIGPSGQLIGFDPTTGVSYSQMAGANYGYESTGSTVDTTYGATIDEFSTSAASPPSNGSYTIRIIGVNPGTYRLGFSGYRDTVTFGMGIGGTQTAPGKISYCVLSFDNNPSVPITYAMQAPTRQIPGGIVNPSGTYNISIRAKPNTMFTNATLETGVATVRWPVASGATMGGVTSSFGYAKWDTLIVISGYNYQKVRSTSGTHIAKWNPNTEYELFYAPMSGTNGPVTVELTNAIPGGEWFVDLNYSDKSDTTFYRRSASVPLPYQKPVK